MTDDPRHYGIFAQAQTVLIQEAVLLDAQDYDGWLTMWDQHGLYIVPTEFEPVDDYARTLNFIFDDQDMRQRRVQRLVSGGSLAMSPPTRTVRTISMVRLTHLGEDTATVASSLLLCANRLGSQRIFACQVEHQINFAGPVPLLLRKVVRLIDADTAQTDLSFML